MPYEQYLHSENIVVLRHSHDYTFSDVMNSIDLAPSKASSQPIFLIFDVRESESPRHIEDFRHMVSYISGDKRFHKRLAIVENMDNPLFYGLARQFQVLCEHAGLELAFFGDLEDAIQYIKPT